MDPLNSTQVPVAMDSKLGHLQESLQTAPGESRETFSISTLLKFCSLISPCLFGGLSWVHGKPAAWDKLGKLLRGFTGHAE